MQKSVIDQWLKALGLTKRYKSAERPLRVGSCRVQQHTRLILVPVYPFANRGCPISAFERELADEEMSERVKHRVARTWVALRVEPPGSAPCRMTLFECL